MISLSFLRMPRFCKKCGVDAPNAAQCGVVAFERHEFVEQAAPAPAIDEKRLDEKIDEHLDKRAKRTLGDAVFLLYLNNQPVGTAFAIDNTHVLSARHNLFNDDELHNPHATAAIVDAFSSSPPIDLRITSCPDPRFDGKKYDEITTENDWIILERTDGGKFRSVIAVKPSTDQQMVNNRPYITIYHFPISFQRVEKPQHNLVSSENRIIGAENFELKCNSLGLISKGSCGGPYVDFQSKTAIGFHIAGAFSYEGKANKQLVDAISNVPVGLHFGPTSSLIVELKRLQILL